MSSVQALSLFGREAPSLAPLANVRRLELGLGAWVDHLPGFVRGHAEVFEALFTGMRWQAHRRRMYERTVDVPRLLASYPEDGEGHPILDEISHRLSEHYGERFDRITMALYRDGHDSVAWHGDKVKPVDCLIPIVSVGTPRRFLLRPKEDRSQVFNLGWGDLLVMGGACQRICQHTVPKQTHAEPRISIMFRQSWVAR